MTTTVPVIVAVNIFKEMDPSREFDADIIALPTTCRYLSLSRHIVTLCDSPGERLYYLYTNVDAGAVSRKPASIPPAGK